MWSRNLVNEEALVHWGLLGQKVKQTEGDVPCNIFILFLSPEILFSLLSDTFNYCSIGQVLLHDIPNNQGDFLLHEGRPAPQQGLRLAAVVFDVDDLPVPRTTAGAVQRGPWHSFCLRAVCPGWYEVQCTHVPIMFSVCWLCLQDQRMRSLSRSLSCATFMVHTHD